MASFADRIKKHAREIGIDKIGIVAATPLEAERRRLTGWLERGFHGNMAWMAREPEKRADPQVLFPGAKSVVVVAVNYYTPHEHGETGKISRYAWGDDYHDIVGERLRWLLDWVKAEEPSVNGKICVDTSPFMDKAWAVRGGLGWLGKHSNVITKDLGSWVFIGSLLLDIELDYDVETIDDHCGTCTACLDACPTGAIVEPYVIDSQKCISYATIELRDETLPENIAANLEAWLYGCDICQDVCPWNRFEQPTAESRFEPRNNETTLDLDAVAEMDHETYVERFRRSAIKRTKLTGLKRNAAALKSES